MKEISEKFPVSENELALTHAKAFDSSMSLFKHESMMDEKEPR